MANDELGRRAFLMAWGVLLVVGVLLAVRSFQVASSVLGAKSSTAEAIAEAGAGADSDSSIVAPAAVRASACERNPFAEPAAMRVALADPEARSEPRPVARFLMVDPSDRVVQIAVGDSLSPRLHVGDRFLGWSVVAILPSSVTVSKAGKSVVLSTP